MNYNYSTFYKHTFCIFTEINEVEINNFKPSFVSKKGSIYYFTEKGVYRKANHWGKVGNCYWRLLSLTNNKVNQTMRTAFAKWNDFYVYNNYEKLFYLEYDKTRNVVLFNHKNNPNYNGIAQLRNTAATKKAIIDCNLILNSEQSLRYLITDSIEELKNEFLYKIINSDITLSQLKRNYLKK
ncbi:hypothetical protein [Flavobacterium sp.]|uniref:hypothetical protein n=1 Tax=Flavobacterium sp. TaxID=239 RepID=UPI003529B93F